MTVLRGDRSVPGNVAGDSRTQVRGSLWPDGASTGEITTADAPGIVTDPEPSAQAQRMALQALIDLGTPLVDEPANEPPSATRAATCTVTVFIPAHNEAASIGATLRSLREQTHPPSHVVVVCDNCTDDTAAISDRHGVTVFTTVGNTARKADALNQALRHFLPMLANQSRRSSRAEVRPGREAEPVTHSPSWPPSRPHTVCHATCGLPWWRGSRIYGCRERRSRPIASAALGTFRRPERATGTIEPERRLACWCTPTSGDPLRQYDADHEGRPYGDEL